MKKIIYLSILIAFRLSMHAQITEPVERKWDYISMKKGIPDNVYFKDVNNVLGRFIGTWKGAYDNKKYEFRIIEFTSDFLKVKEDKLRVSYIISDLNGNVIEDTTTSSLYVMSGRYYHNEGYYLIHQAKGGNCAQGGQMLLYVDESNANAIRMDAIFRNDMGFVDLSECPNMINEYFPTGVIFNLIKQ